MKPIFTQKEQEGGRPTCILASNMRSNGIVVVLPADNHPRVYVILAHGRGKQRGDSFGPDVGPRITRKGSRIARTIA